MTTDGCHNCAHRAGVACAADPPRDKWLDHNGHYPATGATCPGWQEEDGGLVRPNDAAKRYDSAYGATRRAARSWPLALRKEAAIRSGVGSIAHPDDDRTALDVAGEALQEAEDVAGYAGLALLTERWSWRWAVAVWLAGWIARLMQAEQQARGGAR